MASGVNKVILVGNLGRDPEVKFLPSGNAVCNLRIAITERVKKGDNYEDATEWVDVVTFGKTAENAGQYLAKGRQVYVEGRMRTREYEKDGQKRKATEVVANQVLFLGSGGDRAGSGAGPKASGAPGAAQTSGDGFADDGLPF